MGRYVPCPFHEPELRLAVPEMWTADYAMAWFYAEHLGEHVEEMTAEARPICNTCRRIVANDSPVHRPCFDAGCSCDCSDPATIRERTAHADD